MTAAALLCLALSASAAAQVADSSATFSNARSTTSAIVGIRVDRRNVFDPTVKGEDWWPFRMANKIHFLTKEQVVLRELLLKPGDYYHPLKALESERNLRGLGFFREAELRPVPRPGGGSDLLVRTQDSWTTNVQFSVGTEGGENFLTYGASEDNLLGYGKSVTALHSQVGTRKRNELRYFDQRFMGSRFRLTPFYVKTNRGDSFGTEVVQPFFSLETPDAMGAAWERTIDETILYRDGQEYSKFVLANRTVVAGYGVRMPVEQERIQRLEVGWHSQRDRFATLDSTIPGTLPADRELSGPILGYSWVQPAYIKETYVNRMERVEDFNLGNELSLYGGYMAKHFASDRERFVINAVDQQGLFLMPGRFLLGQAGVTGRVANGKWDNALIFANLNVFWKTTWLYPQTWVGHAEVNSGRSLDGENQVILGGNNGLRGYKNNSFVGGRSALLNLENRFFFPGEYFHLVRFGGVVFFDSGAVVPEGGAFSFRRFKSDVGIGLRVSSTRSQSGDVVRVDLAYALNQGPTSSRFVVSIRGRQAFQIFNSSSRQMRQSPGSRLFPRNTQEAP